MKRYGLYGDNSKDFLTKDGKIIWHSNAAELRFLVPRGSKPREIPRNVPEDMLMHIRFHPSFASVRWPLNKEDFRV